MYVVLFSLLSRCWSLARCLSLCPLLALMGPRQRKHRCTQERKRERETRTGEREAKLDSRTKQEDTTENTARIHSPDRVTQLVQSRPDIVALRRTREERKRERERDSPVTASEVAVG